jgi:hypothetical protein
MRNSSQTRKQLIKMSDSKGFIFKKGLKNPTLVIYPNGDIVRADTDLTVCVKMTVKQAFETLGSNS